MHLRPRIVVASPDRAELAKLSEWLSAEGLEPVPVRTLPSAMDAVRARSFDVLVADARFAFEGQLQTLARTTNARAPLVVIGGTERQGTFHIGRPVDQTLLLCHVAMAIIEGRPPRRSLRKRIVPFDAIVEGVNGYVIDVSNEGLRLELPRGRVAPPPYFTLRIPLVGIALTVRRVWMASAPAEYADVSWCGAELFQTHPRAEQNWRAFVSNVPSR
jgi:hypothetical protein